MREETHEETVIEDALHRFNITSVNINCVRDGLKSKERDTYRQDEFIHRKVCAHECIREMREMIEELNISAK